MKEAAEGFVVSAEPCLFEVLIHCGSDSDGSPGAIQPPFRLGYPPFAPVIEDCKTHDPNGEFDVSLGLDFTKPTVCDPGERTHGVDVEINFTH
jgi:hypothetical protein